MSSTSGRKATSMQVSAPVSEEASRLLDRTMPELPTHRGRQSAGDKAYGSARPQVEKTYADLLIGNSALAARLAAADQELATLRTENARLQARQRVQGDDIRRLGDQVAALYDYAQRVMIFTNDVTRLTGLEFCPSADRFLNGAMRPVMVGQLGSPSLRITLEVIFEQGFVNLRSPGLHGPHPFQLERDGSLVCNDRFALAEILKRLYPDLELLDRHPTNVEREFKGARLSGTLGAIALGFTSRPFGPSSST